MAEQSPSPLPQRFFRACLLILGGVIALAVALDLLARVWGWIALIMLIILTAWATAVIYRWWREGR